jgi:hypothetical protein
MDEMSEHALDLAGDRLDLHAAPNQAPVEQDWVEFSIRTASRFAGYFTLAAAALGIAYLVIR